MNLTISQARAYSNRSMLGEMVTVALGKSYVKRSSAPRQSWWTNEVNDSKGFSCLPEGGYRVMRSIND
jgi:hypothetical protein